jgi:glycosyltransferase involved in cell wall biosynthesis
MLKIIQFTTDNREQQNDYENPAPHFGTAPEALLEGFSELPEIEVHVVSCVRREVTIPHRIFGNILYHPVLVPKYGWMSSFYSGCIRATSRVVRDIAPNVVHGQGTERDCAMNAVYSGVPNVVTIHGNMAELNRLGDTFQDARLYGFLTSRLETHALAKTSGVFCNSDYTESLVSPRARRTWRVPNAIRSAFFSESSEIPVSDLPQIINVGLISPRKRQLELLHEAAKMRASGTEFRIVFAGSIPNSPYGKAFAKELQLAEQDGYAFHSGFLDINGLIKLMDQSHAMIHCPTEEAFGLVVAEAMARGLKFFGSDLGGIRDIAGGIPSAELSSDLEELATHVKSWIQCGAPRPNLIKSDIARLYHPRVVAMRHIEIYHELTGNTIARS